jgi:hypothetical protein
MDTVKDAPLTDADLSRIAALITPDFRCQECGHPAEDIARLVAEVRRLRSDEWLEKAAEEIAKAFVLETPVADWRRDAVVEILRKHRDNL